MYIRMYYGIFGWHTLKSSRGLESSSTIKSYINMNIKQPRKIKIGFAISHMRNVVAVSKKPISSPMADD